MTTILIEKYFMVLPPIGSDSFGRIPSRPQKTKTVAPLVPSTVGPVKSATTTPTTEISVGDNKIAVNQKKSHDKVPLS